MPPARSHERRDGLEHDRARGRARTRAARLAGRRARRQAVAIYCSQEVHYSVTRAVERSASVPRTWAPSRWPGPAARARALAEAIDRDLATDVTPIAVGRDRRDRRSRAAIDPLEAIARHLRDARRSWFHVDGAYGLPRRSRGRSTSEAFERAASVSVDAHKWLYLPKASAGSCCMFFFFLSGGQEDLVASFRTRAGVPAAVSAHELARDGETTFEILQARSARWKFWLAMRVHGARCVPPSDRTQTRRGAPAVRDRFRRARTSTCWGPPKLSIVAFRPPPSGCRRPRRAPIAASPSRIQAGRARLDVERRDRRACSGSARCIFVNFSETTRRGRSWDVVDNRVGDPASAWPGRIPSRRSGPRGPPGSKRPQQHVFDEDRRSDPVHETVGRLSKLGHPYNRGGPRATRSTHPSTRVATSPPGAPTIPAGRREQHSALMPATPGSGTWMVKEAAARAPSS
jgi:hypothetical protein